MSPMVFLHVVLEEAPVIPAVFLLHERKTQFVPPHAHTCMYTHILHPLLMRA